MGFAEELPSNIVWALNSPTKKDSALIALEALLVKRFVACLGIRCTPRLVGHNWLVAAVAQEARVLGPARLAEGSLGLNGESLALEGNAAGRALETV